MTSMLWTKVKFWDFLIVNFFHDQSLWTKVDQLFNIKRNFRVKFTEKLFILFYCRRSYWNYKIWYLKTMLTSNLELSQFWNFAEKQLLCWWKSKFPENVIISQCYVQKSSEETHYDLFSSNKCWTFFRIWRCFDLI